MSPSTTESSSSGIAEPPEAFVVSLLSSELIEPLTAVGLRGERHLSCEAGRRHRERQGVGPDFPTLERTVILQKFVGLRVADVEDREAAVRLPVKWSWKMTKPRRRTSMYSFRSTFACLAVTPSGATA